jgi:hypothetical protein
LFSRSYADVQKRSSSSPGDKSFASKDSSSQYSSSSTSTPTEQSNLYAYRISAYVADPAHSHVQHRHTSSQEAMQAHTIVMGSYLEAFDETKK